MGDRDKAIQELQRRAGAPVTLEVSETGDVRVLAMAPRFPVPGHATDPAVVAKDFLATHHDVFQLDAASTTQFIVTNVDNDPTTGLHHVSLTRTFNGIPVFHGGISVHMDSGNNVYRVLGDQSYNIAAPTNRMMMGLTEAALAAGRVLGVKLTPVVVESSDQHAVFTSVGLLDPMHVDQKIVHVAQGDDRFAYQATVSWLDEQKQQQYQLVLIDAQDGSLLANYSLVNTLTGFTGKAFLAGQGAHPTTDTRQLVSFDGTPTSSPQGWVTANTTVGNNANTCTDLNANNNCAGGNETQPAAVNNVFDFPYTPAQDAALFKPAAVASAFYLVNDYHDRTYAYGFTETAGNFQTSNFGLGGAQNDEVQVDAQDGSGTNNANFATPPDGTKPRMQMFLFNIVSGNTLRQDGDFDPGVIYHENTHGVSNRLVGGGTTVCLNGIQSGGMGEGWGDFMGASFLNDPVVGAYPTGNPTVGIRRASMANSTFTYADIKSGALAEVHDAGEVWAATLWTVRNGNGQPGVGNLGPALTEWLVVQGMKNTPCNPTMLQARDGIITADQQLNGGANTCALWKAFAFRKMGLNASSPNDNSTSAIVLSSAPGDIPLECTVDDGPLLYDFSITPNPTSRTIAAGTSTTYTINTAPLTSIAETVALTVSGLPTGVTGTFSPTSVTEGNSSTLTLTAAATAGAGTTSFTITGTSPSVTHTVSALVTVTDVPPTVSITAPTNGSTVSGTAVSVAATATDSDGTVASVKFDLPDGTSVTDNTAPFSITFNSTRVVDCGGYVIRATATDNQGATSNTTVTVTVANGTGSCINVTLTAPTNGSTVSGTAVSVAATATDSGGTVTSVKFDLPDGTSVTDAASPFSTTFDSTKVVNGSGYMIKATATDNQGVTSVTTATITVANCFNNTFSATGMPLAIPDNDPIGITSSIPVTGNSPIASLSLSLNITHPFRGDLSVILISPSGAQFNVSNRMGGSGDNITLTNLAVPTFNGQVPAGTWQLAVQDLGPGDAGKLNSWSLTVGGSCSPVVHWSGSATPNLPTIDDGMTCTSLTVATTGGDSSVAKLDISGRHDFRSILQGTLAHKGITVAAFPLNTFSTGSGTFSFTNRAVPGLSGDSLGTWTFCIIDTDGLGDTGVLNTWSVHD